jgi:RND family efflux transporter MFP subunit
VDDVPVKVWDRVTKGTPLLRLDDRELRSKLISLRAELKVRQAELAKARREFNRNTELHDAQVGTRADFEHRQDELAIATARIAATEAAVSETESLLERFIIRAPIDGTILQINIRAGEQAMPGTSTAPIVLGSIDVLQVRADVDEQLAPRIANGARAVAYRKGSTKEPIALEFVRIEPFIIPKKNLTGSSSERVDTRVLPVIFRFAGAPAAGTYVGQQVDVFIEE